ncbi:hypothetical protein T492DRAFT_347121 [Pavlovales sp. CCMP2436]|nr:hypothetical protein T492DRAFT_347121 [Pavlovales sp. CCMP2436]
MSADATGGEASAAEKGEVTRFFLFFFEITPLSLSIVPEGVSLRNEPTAQTQAHPHPPPPTHTNTQAAHLATQAAHLATQARALLPHLPLHSLARAELRSMLPPRKQKAGTSRPTSASSASSLSSNASTLLPALDSSRRLSNFLHDRTPSANTKQVSDITSCKY